MASAAAPTIRDTTIGPACAIGTTTSITTDTTTGIMPRGRS
jgi:hypothetical protein